MGNLSRIHRTRTPSTNSKWSFKGVLILLVVLLGLGVLIWTILGVSSTPKTPVSSENIWDILIEQGYEPEDVTAYYCTKDSNFQKTLVKCIAFEEDDIHFEFFEFNNKNSAKDIYGQAYTEIILNYNAVHKIEIDHQMANYSIYSLDSLGKYSVAIYVENTALYAYCDSVNKLKINTILDAIDYLKP